MQDKQKFTKEIYLELLVAVDNLPKEAIEKTKKEITKKGYDTTGYQYQFLVNILNEIVGLDNWQFEYKIIHEKEGQWSNGKTFYEITVELELLILNVKRKCVGGHKAELYADALKGAITNAFKKTVAFYGLGKKAYEGTIDEDYRPIPVILNDKPKYKSVLTEEKLAKMLKFIEQGKAEIVRDAMTKYQIKKSYIDLLNKAIENHITNPMVKKGKEQEKEFIKKLEEGV